MSSAFHPTSTTSAAQTTWVATPSTACPWCGRRAGVRGERAAASEDALRPYVLVRWAGRDASDDTWGPLDNLFDSAEAIAAFERATERVLPLPAPSPPAATAAAPPPPIPPAGFTVDVASPPGIWVRRWWGSGCSTGGPARAGSAAPWRVSARAVHSRMWWPTPGRRRRCAARPTRCLTLRHTVPDGCSSPLLLPPG